MIPATDCMTHTHDYKTKKCIAQSQVHDQVMAAVNKIQAQHAKSLTISLIKVY